MVALDGTSMYDGDLAKWVRLDAPSCESRFDASRAVDVRGSWSSSDDGSSTGGSNNSANGTSHFRLSAKFFFSHPGAMQLCYKFRFGGRIAPSAYILFPHIRAIAFGVHSLLPTGTAINCSTQILVRGLGFAALGPMLRWVGLSADSVKCNFSDAFGALSNNSSAYFSHRDATVMNDTHIYCNTPLPVIAGRLPVRIDVMGVESRSHHIAGAVGDGLHVYEPTYSQIDSIRLKAGGANPVGGAFDRVHTLQLVGRFEDHALPRCRFSSALPDAAGGVWYGGGGEGSWEGAAIVHNESFATCTKPAFPGSTRGFLNRFDVTFSSNGQCFAATESRGSSAFYAFNAHVTSLSLAALPLQIVPPFASVTEMANFDTLLIEGQGFQSPSLPDALCRFTRLDSSRIVTHVPAVYMSSERIMCTPPPGEGEVGFWLVELLENGVHADPTYGETNYLVFSRYNASIGISITELQPPGGPQGVATEVVIEGFGFTVGTDERDLACVVEFPPGNVILVAPLDVHHQHLTCILPPMTTNADANQPSNETTAFVSVTRSRSLYNASLYDRSSAIALPFTIYAQPVLNEVTPGAMSHIHFESRSEQNPVDVLVHGSGFMTSKVTGLSSYIRCGFGFYGDDSFDDHGPGRRQVFHSRSDHALLTTKATVINDTAIICRVPHPPPRPQGSTDLGVEVASLRVSLNGQSFTNTTNAPTFYYDSARLHTPELVDAYYSSDLSTLVLVFDKQPTNRAGMVGMEDCSLVFDIATLHRLQSADLSRVLWCGWRDSSTLLIYLNPSTAVEAGLHLRLRPKVIRPAAATNVFYDIGFCAAASQVELLHGTRCLHASAFAISSEELEITVNKNHPCDMQSTTLIEACNRPVAVIQAPKRISNCTAAEIILDVSALPL